MLHYHRKPYSDERSGMNVGGTSDGAEVTGILMVGSTCGTYVLK